jgi:hypothetical protein
VSTEIAIALVTSVLGLLVAGILALTNSWISTRAGIDENLRNKRMELYPKLWKATEAVSRWPRNDVARKTLAELHTTFRSWYYASGGLFLSESARARYGDVQELIATILTHESRPTDLLAAETYTDLMETTSRLRTALTEDLDTRRRKSPGELWRRSRWHVAAARQARVRISRAETSACFKDPTSRRPDPDPRASAEPITR